MAELRIIAEGREAKRFRFDPGPSLMVLLDAARVPVRCGCRGSGACGLCRVRIGPGDAGAPELSETLHLEAADLAEGERLACQVVPRTDLDVEVLAPGRAFEPCPLRDPPRDSTRAAARRPAAAGTGDGVGVAVDVGTTVLSLSLCDLRTGERLAGCQGINPQARAGSDVISRLQAAAESPDERGALAQMVVAAIGDGIWHMALRARVPIAQVRRLMLVGNAAMLALLGAGEVGRQLQPRYWGVPGAAPSVDAEGWALAWGIAPQARIDAVPALLIDFGTNSELPLWDGERLWVTAAAGGPAFEGSGVSCGWPAERGAIAHVRLGREGLALEVIGGGEARGLCGSGLVDLIAALVRSGRLSTVGRFVGDVPAAGFPVSDAVCTSEPAPLALTKSDVDSFQRAKAAIGAGVQALLSRSGLEASSIRRLWLAGAFGAALDLDNARAVGLLPDLADERCGFAGEAALAGCEDALWAADAGARIERLRAGAKLVNLAQYEAFEAAFMDHLYLRPQAGSGRAGSP